MIQPNVLQVKAIEALERNRKNKALVVLPTGAGKTYLAAFHAKKVGAKSILYVVHRNEILDQAMNIFSLVFNVDRSEFGVVNHKSKGFSNNFVFATMQTMGKKKNLKMLEARKFDYTIIDEFHHIAAGSYKRILNHLRTNFILGITATAYRGDTADPLDYIDNNKVIDVSLKEGIDVGVLSPFHYVGLFDNVDYSDIEWNGKRYRESDLDKKLVIDKRDREIVKRFKDACGKRQTLAFCVNVNHVERITRTFNSAGIKAEGLTYKTRPDKRQKVIQAFRDGEFQVLFTRDLFNEGIDFPHVQSLLFLRPTFSKLIFFQQLGRGLRTHKDKKDVLVLDFIGNHKKAFERMNWLRPFLSGSAWGERSYKPTYHYDPKVKITFEQEVIDLFKKELFGKIITKEDLIKNYYTLKKKLHRQPFARDMSRGGYSWEAYRRLFGSWNNFLKEINEPLRMEWRKTVTKQKLIDNYFEVKKRLGRPIVSNLDFRKKNGSKYQLRHYQQTFGSWNKFLHSIMQSQLRKTKAKRLR